MIISSLLPAYHHPASSHPPLPPHQVMPLPPLLPIIPVIIDKMAFQNFQTIIANGRPQYFKSLYNVSLTALSDGNPAG